MNGKTSPYLSQVILRHYHYRSVPNKFRAFLHLEEFHAVAIISKLYYLFSGIIKSKKHLLSLYMEYFIIENTLKFLVVTIIGF